MLLLLEPPKKQQRRVLLLGAQQQAKALQQQLQISLLCSRCRSSLNGTVQADEEEMKQQRLRALQEAAQSLRCSTAAAARLLLPAELKLLEA